MQPRMIIVAGPPGSGKSSAFSLSKFGVDSFNADDRAAELNDGSYQQISLATRQRVNKEFEDFVISHIKDKRSFAIETTLRTDVTLIQAELAKQAGFQTIMIYVCAGDFENCVKRVIARGLAGGHTAPVDVLRNIFTASLRNLRRAIHEIDYIRVYDNSAYDQRPKLVLKVVSGSIKHISKTVPSWLAPIINAS